MNTEKKKNPRSHQRLWTVSPFHLLIFLNNCYDKSFPHVLWRGAEYLRRTVSILTLCVYNKSNRYFIEINYDNDAGYDAYDIIRSSLISVAKNSSLMDNIFCVNRSDKIYI